MSAQVISLFKYLEPSGDWTQRELAEFYRVEAALIQAGLQLETDRGTTDEGEPWFVFCRADTGEAFIHFARIDGKYIAVGSALDEMVEGRDFASLVEEILAGQAWIMAKARNRSNVFLHPSALLIAIVGAAFFHSGEAKAAETADHGRTELRRHVLPIFVLGGGDKTDPVLDANQTAAIVASVLIEWNRLAPTAGADRDVQPPMTAAGANNLAALVGAAHAPAGQGGALQAGLFHESEVAPPPALVSSSHLDGQLSGPVTIVTPVNVPLPDHLVADVSAMDSSLVNVAPAEVMAPFVLSAAVLIETSSTEAAQFVQSSDVLNEIGAQPDVTTPSAALLGLVDQGEHLAAQHVVPASSATQDSASPAPRAVVVTGESSVSSPPASVDSTAPATASPLAGLPNIDPHIAAAVLQFVGEVSVLDVAIQGRDIILYDGAIFQHLPAGTLLDSVTFNFADGSSISLVGTAPELQALHLT